MPKINVYLPEWLADAVRESPMSVSAVCQRALTDELAAQPTDEAVEPLLTNRAREAIRRARRSTRDDLALLAGLEEEGGNLALVVLDAIAVDRARLRERVTGARARGGPDVTSLVTRAAREAADLGDEHIGCEHLLLALVADAEAPAARLLARLGADPARIVVATRAAAAAAAYTRAQSAATVNAALADVRHRLRKLERR